MRYRLYTLTTALLLGVLLLTACQHDALSGGERDGTYVVSHTDSSYINLCLVNSRQGMTRAAIAATAAENAIYDGILCIFEGADQASAILKTAVVIDQFIQNPGTANASQTINITQRLATGTHAYGGRLYVLALLNTSSTGFRVSGTDLYLNGTSLMGTTIDHVHAQELNAIGSTDEHVGLFMTNTAADLYKEVSAAYLFDTPEKASAGGRLTITVERIAARLTVINGATTLTSINLNGNDTTHPLVHRIAWTVNGQAHRYGSGDVVYLPEGSVSIVVELQLKDASSMLMHEGFVFHPFSDSYVSDYFTDLYTTPELYLTFLRASIPPENKQTFGLGNIENKDIFKHAAASTAADGTVNISLVNSDLENQQGLSGLASFLSTHTTAFRDGKMYYTFTLDHVVRNNAYSLTLQSTSIHGLGRPTP